MIDVMTDAGDRIRTLDGGSFRSVILEGEGRIAVEFMSYGCGYCRAIEPILHGPASVDAATKLTWSKASLTAWVGKADLTSNLPAMWAYSSNLYNESCGSCHALHPADGFLANQWIGNLKAMKRFTALDDGQYRLLQAYLQFHSKDVGADAAGKKL